MEAVAALRHTSLSLQHKNRNACNPPDLAAGADNRYDDGCDRVFAVNAISCKILRGVSTVCIPAGMDSCKILTPSSI